MEGDGMIGFLLASTITIPCADGWKMINRINQNDWLEPQTKKELIIEIKKVMDCDYYGRQEKTN